MFLDLGRQPIANNFLTLDQFEGEFFYHLEIYFCPECFTVQIGDCPDCSNVFNKNYPFFTGSSIHMVNHFAELANLIKENYLPKNGCIMEIGSNDGTFLEHFKNILHLGFDPSESVNAVARAKGVRVYPHPFEGFDENIIARWPKINVFVSANAFAHIPDRCGVLNKIKQMLASDGVWIDEQPYLGNIINQLAYDQFYNEHIFYTSIASMQKTLTMYDLEIIDFEFIWTHGGSIRYFIGHKKAAINMKIKNAIEAEGFDNFEVFNRFGKEISIHAAKIRQDLANLGIPAVGYGATAKSTTVLNYCNIGQDLVLKIYDTTPSKQGKFSPGKHIPIVPYEAFKKDNPKNVILFAWNHIQEILAKEAGIERNWICL